MSSSLAVGRLFVVLFWKRNRQWTSHPSLLLSRKLLSPEFQSVSSSLGSYGGSWTLRRRHGWSTILSPHSPFSMSLGSCLSLGSSLPRKIDHFSITYISCFLVPQSLNLKSRNQLCGNKKELFFPGRWWKRERQPLHRSIVEDHYQELDQPLIAFHNFLHFPVSFFS